MKNKYMFLFKSNFLNSWPIVWMVFLCLFSSFNAKAEGVQGVAPSSDDIVMLLIGDPNYGNFATEGSPESSRLYVQFLNEGEVLYLGLSREYNASGNASSTGNYSYVIKRASDNAVVHGPFGINSATANISNWEEASGPDVLNGGIGYETDHNRYKFTPNDAGLYYIEFSSVSYIGLWDFTVADNNVEIPGRVYSKNWAFRTPSTENSSPECVWDREFNGSLYSYTSDGFVTRLDFADSGFQGLSFTMSFNSRGPGESGVVEVDRMSIPEANVNDDFAEHLVFLSEPDPMLFPDGDCGVVNVAPYFQCVGSNSYCLEVDVTQPGQLELVIDVNNNNNFDEGIDRRLFYLFEEGESLSHCMFWDGLLGDGTSIDPGASVNLLIQYTQGIQHWSVFDAEFLKEGFCVEPIRPLCNVDLTLSTLYWDDRNILEEPGTGQPKDGTVGCDCESEGCRTWNNFNPNDNDCNQINDNLTTGYGDKSILNTWWFAHIEERIFANVPLVNVTIQGDSEICSGASAELSFLFTSTSNIVNIVWTGPQGIITQGANAPMTIQATQTGIYTIEIIDDRGWSYSDTHELSNAFCATDLELDITVNDLTPATGDVVDFSVTITNTENVDAIGFEMSVYWDEAIGNIQNITNGGQWNGNTIVWNNLNLDIGQSIEITFSATVLAAFDYVISAEITDFPQGDIDSTPNNGVDTDGDGNCADDSGDEDDGDCVILIPAACAIQISVANIICDANGTADVANDDTYSFDLTVEGSNGDESWIGELGGTSINGNYGQMQHFGPFDIADGNINVTVADGFFATCTDIVTAQTPATCSNQCSLSFEEGDIICSDNGTNDNPGDDTYTFSFTINGLNTATSWVASDGSTGIYNTLQTYGPYNINDGNQTLVFTDNDDPSCSISHTFEAPEACSANCSLNGTIGQAICSNNGTPSDASDDTYTFTVTINGFNTSTSGWLANDALTTSGDYGNVVTMGPYAISGGDVSFEITDVDQETCSFVVNVQAPTTCSNLCAITLVEGEVLCLDNSTPSNGSDDLFTVQVRLIGNNTATQWTASNNLTGAFDEWVTLGPFLISDGDVNLTFIDDEDENCSVNASFQAPSPCSTNCSISTSVSTALCTDGGTPSDPSDDSFSFLLTVSGSNISTAWTADDINASEGVYNQAVLMGPYPISGGAVSITITDSDNAACFDIVNVNPPVTCSNLCDIETLITGAPSCFDNGTLADNSDDTYSFIVTVSGNNTASQWTASNGQTGNYNEPTEIGPFSIAAGAINITFTDNDNTNCTSSLNVSAPPACSTTCDITSVDVTNIICNDNGTPIDPTDDTFTFSVRLNGFNLGGSWTTTSGESGEYGQNEFFGPYPVATGNITLDFIDNQSSDCTASIIVNAPETCSSQCAIESMITNVQCSDNETPFDPGDDLFTFDLIVTAINHTAESWVSGDLSGSYGNIQVQGPFLIADGAFVMTIQDVDDASCSTIVDVTPPATCSDDCLLTIEVLSTNCDENNTELDVNDDTFSYTISVNSINGGTSWIASDGTTGNFGEIVQSVEHAYSEGTLNITVVNEQGDCMGEFSVSPPEPNLVCPEDTDQKVFNSSVQVLMGHLGDPDDLIISDIPCFAALHSTPMKLGDRFLEIVDILTPEGEEGAIDNVYTFYFFSNIEPSTGVTDYDGVGEIFRGNYLGYTDPCCFNMGYRDSITTNGINPIIQNPYVDTAGMFGQDMHLVQRFSHSLKTNQEFTLVATTYGVQETGDYAWVIVSEVTESMEVSLNVTSSFMENETLRQDLTYFDINLIMDNPIESQIDVGEPVVEPYCGAEDLFLSDALVFEDSCTAATLNRTYYLTYGDQIDSCLQTITFRRPIYDDIILPPSTYTIQCGDDIPLNEAGFPDPLETGYPLISSGSEYVPLLDTVDYFNLGVSYKDTGNPDSIGMDYSYVREWVITDACSGDTTHIIPQLIKFGEFNLPSIRCPLTDNCDCPNVAADVMLFDVDPGDCTATLEIPEPIITGFCDSSRIADWYVVTELLNSDTIALDSIFSEDADRSIANLERGDYLVRYSMEDNSGNRVERMCRLRIADFQVPTAVCKSGQTILLSEIETTRIFPQDIDLGSYDNCDIPSFQVRRYFDQNAFSCELLDEEGYGEWSPFVDFNCCDEGQSYTVQLRIMDADSNVNVCNVVIEVIDDIAPQLYGLEDQQVSCSSLPFNFDPTDSLSLIQLFGYPNVNDNCLVETRTLAVELVWNDCELGSILRHFEATDRAGNTSLPYEQFISISADNSYGIRFSADKTTDCLGADTDPVFRSEGCGVFEMSFEDNELPVEGDACRRIQRTYSVINTCDYDGISDPVIISRNENCNGEEGEENVWLIIENSSAFIDVDSMSTNAFPPAGEQGTDCASTTNPIGYWRSIENIGYWKYSQIITIVDQVPPMVIYTAPEPSCSTDDSCEGEVTVLLSIIDACPLNQVDVSLWFDENADGSLDQELTSSPVLSFQGTSYIINGDFPIGNHAFVLTAKDDCNNEVTERIDFSVVDCFIAQPICKTGLEVQLSPIVPAMDLDGDGILDEGAYISAAALLADEMLGDCSPGYTFSISKIVDEIDFSNTNMVLTCEDRYLTTRQITVRDNAFNPYAIQPDGTIGGPNYSTCTIEIVVQDEQEVCSACADSELEIEGIIRTHSNQPISDVEVRLLENDIFDGETFTIQDGKYEFPDLIFSTNFKVKPYKNDDIHNGVTTIDLIRLQKHLLLIEIITDPYVLLAADLNQSGTVTTLDLLLMRELLLERINEFPNNTSWRFIPTSFPLTDIAADIPDSYSYVNLVTCQFAQDFIGVKIGDLNGSASLSNGLVNEQLSNRNLWPLLVSHLNMMAGDVYRVPILLSDAQKASGLDLNLSLDPSISIIEIEPGLMTKEEMATQNLNRGLLKGIWVAPVELGQENTLFTLVIKAQKDVRLSDVLKLSSSSSSTVYNHSLVPATIGLSFSQGNEELVLLGNAPDPFREWTTMSFYLPNAGNYVIKIHDVNGKLLQTIEKEGIFGIQKLKIRGDELPTGVLFYTLVFGDKTISRRMIKYN